MTWAQKEIYSTLCTCSLDPSFVNRMHGSNKKGLAVEKWTMSRSAFDNRALTSYQYR